MRRPNSSGNATSVATSRATTGSLTQVSQAKWTATGGGISATAWPAAISITGSSTAHKARPTEGVGTSARTGSSKGGLSVTPGAVKRASSGPAMIAVGMPTISP